MAQPGGLSTDWPGRMSWLVVFIANRLSRRGLDFLDLAQERDEHTLEQVGNTFGLTRERIRQIEAAALAKLQRTLRRS